MSFFEWLDHIDKILFTLIQHDSDRAVMDVVMPILRNPYTWIPLYVFMLYYAIRHARQQAWSFIALSLLTFAITDSLTSQIMKPFFARLRPCHDGDLASSIRVLVDCGGLFSMPSSHAANHFGLAAFWYISIRNMNSKKWWWLYVWAAAICYAQVYVGKHFPFDTLVGAITGWVTGFGLSRIFTYLWERRNDNRYNFIAWGKKIPGNIN